MIATASAHDTRAFDPWNDNLARLTMARAICLQVIEAHNMGEYNYLDRDGIEEIRNNKRIIEDAARQRFNVRVWL